MAQEFEEVVDGVDEGDSQESAQSTADAMDGQPNGTDRRIVDSEKTKQKINLDEYPEFRRFKSEYDRKLAETERRYQQMLAQQQDQLRQRQLSEMDDYQRLEYELNEERQRAAVAYQRLQEVEVEQAKMRVLREVSAEMGVPVEAIAEAQDVADAWRLAAIKQREIVAQRETSQRAEAERRAAERMQKQQNNRVDLGSGAPIPTNDWERSYDQFRKAKDPWSMFQHALSDRQG
jgi:predicted ribosome quality control (RQC) complex YloA/Tae2 family protein